MVLSKKIKGYKMNKKIIVGMGMIIGAILLSGCGYSSVALDSTTKSELRGKTITAINKQYPVRPTDYSGFGTIPGNISSQIESKKSSNPTYGKPSTVLNKKIISHLVTKNGLVFKQNSFAPQTRGSESVEMTNASKVDYVALQKYNTDYVLDVNTYWQIQSIFSAQMIRLRSDIRLIDNKKHKIVAQVTCDTETMGLKDNSHSHDELYANNGALIKKITSRAINSCMEKVKQTTLK